jgi:hypothetical protein
VQTADEMYDLLEKPRVERSEKIYIEGSQYSFLEKIICPIHEILAAVSCDSLFLFWLLANLIGNVGKCIQVQSDALQFLLVSEVSTQMVDGQTGCLGLDYLNPAFTDDLDHWYWTLLHGVL